MPPKTDDTMQFITTILAISSAVGPILFGFVIWKMMQIFVTNEKFEAYKSSAETDRRALAAHLSSIETDVKELLQRTADRRLVK